MPFELSDALNKISTVETRSNDRKIELIVGEDLKNERSRGTSGIEPKIRKQILNMALDYFTLERKLTILNLHVD